MRLAVPLMLLAACTPARPVARSAPSLTPTWTTLRAEHRVALEVELDGKAERRSLRGVIAVQRPDRLRLRALGPGGITLFDLLVIGGRVLVKDAIRDPHSASMRPLIEAMAGDLSASYLLEPAPPDRRVVVEGDSVLVSDNSRSVRLSDWQRVGEHAVPGRITIDNRARRYRATVDARAVELDTPLDPQLFSE